MKAEDRLKTPSKYKIENSPKTIAWYAVSQGLEHEVDAIAEMIEQYHQYKLQALKEGVEELESLTSMKIKAEAYQEVINLITNTEEK